MSKQCKILVVVSEYLTGQDLRAFLRDAGIEVIGPFSKISEAFEVLKPTRVDGALIELKLAKAAGCPHACLLREKSIPFAYFSGYNREAIPEALRDVPVIGKPFSREAVISLVYEICGNSFRVRHGIFP